MSFSHWLAGLTKKIPTRPRHRRSIGNHRRASATAPKASECLEQRILLAAASVTGTTLNVVDSGAEANSVTLSLSGSSLLINDSANPLTAGSGTTQVNANTVSVLLASVTDASFTLGDNDDSLTIAFASGSPLLSGGITFDGGADSGGGDSLSLTNVGSSFPTHTYDYTNANDGTITLNDGAADFAINFLGLEPISNDGRATNIVFNLPAGGNGDVVLQDSASSIIGSMQLSGSTFENTTFSSPGVTSLTINGNTGNDSITVAGRDPLFGGTITLSGQDGNDTLSGSSFSDIINGGAGDDSIIGGDQNDTITGGTGNDTLNGGNGDDVFTWDNGDGTDTIDGGAGRDVQTVNFGDLAGEGDTVTVTDGGGGRVNVARAAGTALGAFTLNLGTVETIKLNLLDGDDIVDASASPIGLTINGGDGADSISGSALVDRINGDAGNDTLMGLDGADVISGGVGSDTIRGDDSASGTGGADTIVGGVANPMVIFRTNFGDIPIELFADQAPNTVASFLDYVDDDDYINSFIHRSIAGFVIQGGGFTTSTTTFNQGTTVITAVPTDPPILNEGNGVGNRSNVRGTISTAQQGGNINTFTSQWFVNLADNLGLNAVPHVVFGNVLDMTVPDLIAALATFNITAETGNGALTDTPLSDTPVSGNGNFVVVNSVIYSIVPSSTSVDVDGDDLIYGAAGSDTLYGSGGNDTLMGDAGADSLLGGDGDDTLRGAAGADSIFGEAGNDMVFGQGASDDVISGGTGDDTLDGGPGPSTLVESADGNFTLVSGAMAGEGTLTGNLTGTDVLIGVERAQLTGGNSANTIDVSGFTGPVTLDGGAGNDILTGGSGGAVISGGAGNDILTGGDGGATITGGAGLDTITGGAGNDDLRGGDDNDQINGGAGLDLLFGDAGNDSLNGGDDNDTLNGSAGSDTLNGAAGDDVLNGNGGSGDILTGGTGNDTLDGGDGDDRVSETSDTNFVLTDSSLTSAATGTDELISIEGGILTGGAGNNSINASAFSGTSSLNGGAGDDTLSASAQASVLNGEAGNDSITGSAQNDVITGGSGNDTVNAAAGNDSVSGDDGDDLINGGLGADTISGGNGNDRLIGVSNADITAAVTSLASLNATNSDSIDGGAGNDTIVGGVGSDTVNGGDGLDIIDVASGGDTTNGRDSVITSLGGDMIFADPEDIIA